MLTFQVEKWASFVAEARPLFQKHWQEIAVDRHFIKLSVDESRYEAMDASGILHILSARLNERLIGYYMAFLIPHIHYSRGGLMAFTDVYYLDPSARNTSAGIRLFVEAEKSLKERGVTKAYLSHKAHKNNGPLFEKLGWKLTDLSYCKILNAPPDSEDSAWA